MSQVNLLPPELRQQLVTRRTTTLVAGVGLIVLAVIGFVYFIQTMNLSRAQSDLTAQQQVNGQVQAQISDLSKYSSLQAELQAKQTLVKTVFTNEISWSGVLLDVSRAIPVEAYLTSLTGQVTAVAPGAAPPTTGGVTAPVGSLSFAGTVLNANTLAAWLVRLEQVKGWVNAWAQNAAETGAYSKIYTFSSGVDLTPDALTARGRGGQL